MFPIRDTQPSYSKPVVTVCLIVVNILVFLFEFSLDDYTRNAFIAQYGLIPDRFAVANIFTSMFLHAGWLHILGNMVFLWAFGPEIEDAMGRGRYLLFYLLGGVIAMLAQVVADSHSTIPNLGASGAIAAVMGAFLITYPRDQIRAVLIIFIFVRITFIPAALLIGFWFLTQLFHAGQVAQVQTGGVAYLAHVGGFVFGAATARLFERNRRLSEMSSD